MNVAPAVLERALFLVLGAVGFGVPSALYPGSVLMGSRINSVRQHGAAIAAGAGVVTLTGVFVPTVTGRAIGVSGGPPPDWALSSRSRV